MKFREKSLNFENKVDLKQTKAVNKSNYDAAVLRSDPLFYLVI